MRCRSDPRGYVNKPSKDRFGLLRCPLNAATIHGTLKLENQVEKIVEPTHIVRFIRDYGFALTIHAARTRQKEGRALGLPTTGSTLPYPARLLR